jgi:hypothetical protein
VKSLLNWLAAAASLAGLFLTLRPAAGSLTAFQVATLAAIALIFGAAAVRDIRDERRRAAKTYKNQPQINDYMHALLRDSGRCEICSRDASWISEQRIYTLLQDKAKRGELTFLVHKSTPELERLAELGAELIVYGPLGFDPVTRFTVANSGNQASSYVAIGRKKPNEPHTIEELDSSHPTYSMAVDLIRSIRAAHAQLKAS